MRSETMFTIKSDKPVLFVDGSYFIFYRYFATYNWFRLQDFDTASEDIMADPTFVAKYAKMFEKTIVDLIKKKGLSWDNAFFMADCPREEVFRNAMYDCYKQARETHASFNANVFEYTYNTLIPELQKKYPLQVVQAPCLEADDLVAIFKKHVREQDNSQKVVIVTNDNDYVQLYDEHTSIVNLQGKELNTRLPVPQESYLLYKIIGGDKSDCISPIKAKIGPKTAEKLAINPVELEAYLTKHPDARERFELNSGLIDMNNIPEHLKAPIIENIVYQYLKN